MSSLINIKDVHPEDLVVEYNSIPNRQKSVKAMADKYDVSETDVIESLKAAGVNGKCLPRGPRGSKKTISEDMEERPKRKYTRRVQKETANTSNGISDFDDVVPPSIPTPIPIDTGIVSEKVNNLVVKVLIDKKASLDIEYEKILKQIDSLSKRLTTVDEERNAVESAIKIYQNKR